ncbi:MAG: hypothetical protein LJE94_17460 [Deltaproteobacteria bacterium]|nr:hypothetical protein [Deltaproteobacteria bacterium]
MAIKPFIATANVKNNRYYTPKLRYIEIEQLPYIGSVSTLDWQVAGLFFKAPHHQYSARLSSCPAGLMMVPLSDFIKNLHFFINNPAGTGYALV